MPPILDNKNRSASSLFLPASLLREARRQKGIATVDVPPVCILDPDGDIVRRLRQAGKSQPFKGWPCYHTELDTFSLGAHEVGIVGRVVGASFAVLVAEELFASGCRLLVSLTSAGQITPAGPPPYFVIIDRALRDEGTSYHYAPAAEFAEADPALVGAAANALATLRQRSIVGSTGPRMLPSVKRRKPSRRREPKVFSRSRWKPRRSMPSRARQTRGCYAWLTSPTRWA
jgi:hypothetical protein